MAEVVGTAGNDNLTGTNGADEIFGFGGDDIINGGAGDDLIRGDGDAGQFGTDEMTGGAGNDVFSAYVNNFVNDVITDFDIQDSDGDQSFDRINIRIDPPETVTTALARVGNDLRLDVTVNVGAITASGSIILEGIGAQAAALNVGIVEQVGTFGGTDLLLVAGEGDGTLGGLIAEDDTFTAAEGVDLTGVNVLDNDEGGDGATLTVTEINGSANNVGQAVALDEGTVTVSSNGNLTFTPLQGISSGTATFTYTVSDGSVDSTGTVTINIDENNNTAPVAQNDLFTVVTDAATGQLSATGFLLQNDTDADNDTLLVQSITFNGVTTPIASGNNGTTVPLTFGTVAVNQNGGLAYVLTPGATSADTFSYTVTDGIQSSSASVSFSIDPGATITGTDGNDNLRDSGSDDVIEGLAGDDRIRDSGGSDDIRGGNGNDRIRDTGGFDNVLSGGNGDDQIDGRRGEYTANGGDGNDRISINGDGRHVINGDNGDDIISLKGGFASTVNGGAGRDVIRVKSPGPTTIDGGTGDDVIRVDSGSNAVIGGAGRDELRAGKGNDTFIFRSDSEQDIISRFGQKGFDQIVIQGVRSNAVNNDLIDSFEELLTFANTSDRDVVFDFANGSTLRLENVGLEDLASQQFLFLDTSGNEI